MSDSEDTGAAPAPAAKQHISWSDSYTKANTAIKALASIVRYVPASLSSSETPAFSRLHDSEIAAQISDLLRQPDSSAGDNNLCRWLYDTFHSSEPDLHLVVLRFLPIIAGVYLSRVALHKPLAGFEAILLALYAHETVARNGHAVTVTIPDLSHSSIYHETKQTTRTSSTELALAVISSSLEPYTSVRSTKRARIVGVALELFYSKISQIPLQSKLDFCYFCKIWAGEKGIDPSEAIQTGKNIKLIKENGENEENAALAGSSNSKEEKKKGRIILSREILQPTLRILGHCMMANHGNKDLQEAARAACRCLYARALHDISPKDILATGSLLRLANLAEDSAETTKVPFTALDRLVLAGYLSSSNTPEPPFKAYLETLVIPIPNEEIKFGIRFRERHSNDSSIVDPNGPEATARFLKVDGGKIEEAPNLILDLKDVSPILSGLDRAVCARHSVLP
nr:hyccin [Ipomoea batatas]